MSTPNADILCERPTRERQEGVHINLPQTAKWDTRRFCQQRQQEGRNEQLTPLSPVFHSLRDRLRPKWGLYRGGLISRPKVWWIFFPAVADNICLKLIEKFSQPGVHFLAQPYMAAEMARRNQQKNAIDSVKLWAKLLICSVFVKILVRQCSEMKVILKLKLIYYNIEQTLSPRARLKATAWWINWFA